MTYINTNLGCLDTNNSNDWKIIYDMYREGSTYEELGIYLGISKSILYRIIKKCNFTKLTPQEILFRNSIIGLRNKNKNKGIPRIRGKRKPSKIQLKLIENEEIIRSLYLNEKKGSDYIANILEVSPDTLKKYLKSLGIMRSYTESMNVYSEYHNNYTNIHFFDSIDTEEKAYWLGFVVADGNIDKDKHVLTIGLKGDDEGHLKKFSDIFSYSLKKYKLKKYENIKKDRVMVSCRISNTYLCSQLVNKGILPRKTYINGCTVWKHVPKELYSHFIRGVFDGDGCVSFSKHNNCKTSCMTVNFLADKILIEEIQEELIETLGINRVKIRHDKYNSSFGNSSNRDVRAIYDYLYEDASIYLERKKDIFNKYFKL